tara:strand:+ start:330 stop:1511 length:1182 start_codon:yes stop_codon:yes gene_type:complete
MSKFKMQSPIKLDPVPRYDVPFMPDNVEDNSGLVAKANKNGTMIVNKNIPKNSKLYKQAKSHEDHHLKDMMQGKLDYDANAVYHNLDGKGVKRVDRKNFDESNKNLPWEKQAYKAGVAMEDKDMRPNPNKLDGPPNMKEKDTPLSYYKIGSKPRRESDMDNVSMTERFGNAMIKKFGPAKTGCAISKYGGPAKIELGKDTDASGETEEEKKLKKEKIKWSEEKQVALKEGDLGFDDPDLNVRKFEQKGTRDYYQGTKKMSSDDWANWLKTPAGQRYTENLTKSRFEVDLKPIKPRENPIEVSSMPEPRLETFDVDGFDEDKKKNFTFKFPGRKGKGKNIKQKLSATEGDTSVCRVDEKGKPSKGCKTKGMSRGKTIRKVKSGRRKLRRSGGLY